MHSTFSKPWHNFKPAFSIGRFRPGSKFPFMTDLDGWDRFFNFDYARIEHNHFSNPSYARQSNSVCDDSLQILGMSSGSSPVRVGIEFEKQTFFE